MNMCLMDMMLMEDDYAGFLSVADIAMKDIMDNNPNAIRSNDVFVLYSLASSS